MSRFLLDVARNVSVVWPGMLPAPRAARAAARFSEGSRTRANDDLVCPGATGPVGASR